MAKGYAFELTEKDNGHCFKKGGESEEIMIKRGELITPTGFFIFCF